MLIYKAERSIAQLVLSNCSIAYTTEISPWTKDDRQKVFGCTDDMGVMTSAKLLKVGGSVNDGDLYFTKSILVSTNWNRNDDVFDKLHTWAARHTPTHKRTNIEHDEKQLVGHITNTWALDANGNIIPDDIDADDLPSLYHIANGAVIYMVWEDKELEERAKALVTQIEEGKKFVSMEALFSDFDYAVVTPEQKFHVVTRGAETAFLTKHLRVYGGTGEYEGCRIGRLLRGITFCGKGYVDKPANPYSVIFNSETAFDFASVSPENPFEKQNGVFIFCSGNTQVKTEDNSKTIGETLMGDTAKDVELQAKIDDLQKQNQELTAAKNKADSDNQGLVTENAGLKEKLAAAEKAVSDLTTAKGALETQLADVNKAKASLEEKIAQAEADKVKTDRITRLTEGGYTKDEATKKVETFASLTAEQFDVLATELVEAKKVAKKKDEKKDGDGDGDGCAASNTEPDPTVDPADKGADTKALDAAQATSEPALSPAPSAAGDDVESLRDELRKALATRLGHDTEDDGSGDADGE